MNFKVLAIFVVALFATACAISGSPGNIVGGMCIEGTEEEQIADCKVKCDDYVKRTNYGSPLKAICVKEVAVGKTYNVCRCRD